MNWNKFIKVEVRLPYITRGCTLGYSRQDLTIYPDSIWFTGHTSENLRWKAEFWLNNRHILISGKATPKSTYVFNLTSYKLEATNTHDGIRPGNEKYSVKFISCS